MPQPLVRDLYQSFGAGSNKGQPIMEEKKAGTTTDIPQCDQGIDICSSTGISLSLQLS